MTVRCDHDGAIAVITIDRPERRNAIDDEHGRALVAALDEVEARAATRVAVLTGAGSVFSSGADLKAMASGGVTPGGHDGFSSFLRYSRTKPLVAAVDGPALAGGFEIVLACDLIVASSRASFGLPEVSRSLVAAGGGLFRLPRVVPRNVALEIGMTGAPITAERAFAVGLVNELTAPGEALDAALRLAGRVLLNAPLAVEETRRAMLSAATLPDDDARWAASAAALARAAASVDGREGLQAFVEKRAPVWKGC